jgi:hypothetical protein
MARAGRHDDVAEEGKDNGDRFNEDGSAVLNLAFRNHKEIEQADCELVLNLNS